MVCGLPGTGKTYISRRLAERLGIEHLSSDAIRKQVIRNRTYSEDEKQQVYSVMAEKARNLLQSGKSVIVDATFYQEKYRNMFLDIAKSSNIQAAIIECILEEHIIRKRMEQRRTENNDSEADFAVYETLRGKFEHIQQNHLLLDMSLPEAQILDLAADYIGDA
jgi:hypothetical protein